MVEPDDTLFLGGLDSAARAEFEKELSEFSRVLNCGVCLDFYDRPSVLTDCGHMFCEDCLASSMRVKNCCPMCGNEIRRRSIEPGACKIYLNF